MMEFMTSNWEWCLLGLYVLEKAILLSPSKKDDMVWNMVLKPLVDKLLFGNLKGGGLIKLDIEKGKLKFTDTKTKVKA